MSGLSRRRFAFWLGFGLFGAAEKLRADVLDELAAALMRHSPRPPESPDAALLHSAARLAESDTHVLDRIQREPGAGQPDESRRANDGRPPSKWLRSLYADELRVWLATIDVPEAGVSGMTFWTHLTRDHGFHPSRIQGLVEDEQAKLHAAAHYGY